MAYIPQDKFAKRAREKGYRARENFAPIARSIGKWIDDCGLFVFGYLIRKFWEIVGRILAVTAAGAEY